MFTSSISPSASGSVPEIALRASITYLTVSSPSPQSSGSVPEIALSSSCSDEIRDRLPSSRGRWPPKALRRRSAEPRKSWRASSDGIWPLIRLFTSIRSMSLRCVSMRP